MSTCSCWALAAPSKPSTAETGSQTLVAWQMAFPACGQIVQAFQTLNKGNAFLHWLSGVIKVTGKDARPKAEMKLNIFFLSTEEFAQLSSSNRWALLWQVADFIFTRLVAGKTALFSPSLEGKPILGGTQRSGWAGNRPKSPSFPCSILVTKLLSHKHC